MSIVSRLLALLTVFSLSASVQAQDAQRGAALVVGVERYEHFPGNPSGRENAQAFAGALINAGWDVTGGEALLDPTWEDISRALVEFKASLSTHSVGLVYFSGHSARANGDNYVLPADANEWTDANITREAFRMNEFWSFPRGEEPPLMVVVVDTRGSLGLLGEELRGSGTGLSPVEAPPHVAVAMSDSPRDVTLYAQETAEALMRQHSESQPFWAGLFQSQPIEPVTAFTQSILDASNLGAGNIVSVLEDAVIRTREATFDRQQPYVAISELDLFNLALDLGDLQGSVVQSEFEGLVQDHSLGTALAGRDMIKMFEGLRLAPYVDQFGVATVGYGHTGAVTNADRPISRDRAEELLSDDIETAMDAIRNHVEVEINANQQAALVSLIFNVGTSRFIDSTLLEELNAGNYERAADEMSRWTHGHRNGVLIDLPGLVARREVEEALFLTPPGEITGELPIRIFEEFNTTPVADGDRYIVGYGHELSEPAEDFELTEIEAEELLQEDVARLEAAIDELIDVDLSAGQLAGLVSFAHDVGIEVFRRSPVVQRLNRGDVLGAASALRFYTLENHNDAIRHNETLIHRRASEAALFFAH